MARSIEGHGTKVEYLSYAGGTHSTGYPFRATCWCGWKSKTYASMAAAQIMAEDHLEHPADLRRTVLV